MSVQSSLDRLKKQLNLQPAGGEASPVRRPVPLQSAFYNPAEFPEYRDFANMGWYYDKQGTSRASFVRI